MQELLITNIQRMSFHDGPGMRTTVFLKGCNLRCAWCHNPETQNPQPELIFRAQRCVRCGTCVHSCASGARTMGPEGPVRDTARCVGCGRCAQACLTGAIDVAGRRISCQELTELVLRDEKIFRTTAGGVTCSGGEPLLQADAVAELLGGMHARGLHTCVDTAGNVPWEAFEQVLPVTDLFLYDVKAYSPQTLRQFQSVLTVGGLPHQRESQPQPVHFPADTLADILLVIYQQHPVQFHGSDLLSCLWYPAARSSGFAEWKSSDPIAASFAAIIPRSEAKRNGMSMFFEFKG